MIIHLKGTFIKYWPQTDGLNYNVAKRGNKRQKKGQRPSRFARQAMSNWETKANNALSQQLMNLRSVSFSRNFEGIGDC